MKKKVFSILIALVLGTSLALAACAAPAPAPEAESEWPKTLLFGSSSPPTSSWYPAQCKAAELGARGTGIPTTVTMVGGSVATLQAIYDGELDVGHLTLIGHYESIHGKGFWEGKPLENRIRVFYFRNGGVCPPAVRADSGIDSIADMEGKVVYCGYPGSSHYSVYAAYFDALGIEYEEFVGSLPDAVAAFKDGRLDVLGKMTSGRSVDASHLDIMSTIDIKFVGVTEEETKIVQAKYPYVSFRTVPAGWYPQLPDLGEITFGAIECTGGADKDFPEELAYRWTKSYIENYDECRAVFAGAKDYNPTAALMQLPPDIKLHPGAVRYYREVGVEFPESAIPPEMK